MMLDRRIRKSRAALRSALFNLMKQKPLCQITVKELCQVANVNRSTFYANFGAIEDLLSEIHAQFFRDIESALLPRDVHPDLPASTSVPEFLRIIHLMCAQDSPLPVLLRNNETHLFERNMTQHFMARFSPAHATSLQRYSFSFRSIGCFHIIIQWMTEGMPCPAEDLAILLNQLCTPAASQSSSLQAADTESAR